METPSLLFAYPPECCAERHETTEALGAEQFAGDYAAGWRRRALWKRLVSSLRVRDPAYWRAYATGYARAAQPLAAKGWDQGAFVAAALAAASAPPT
jgi:hypothetical protein